MINEVMKGFKTLEEAEKFKESILGDWLIVELYSGSIFSEEIVGYFLKEKAQEK